MNTNIELENAILKEKLALAQKTLEEIINGCCNPEVALRRVMLELKPIRETLKKIG